MVTTDIETGEQDPLSFADSLNEELIALPTERKKRESRTENDELPKRPRAGKKKLKAEIRGALVMGNTVFAAFPMGQTYGLSEPEIDALTDALYAEIEANPQWAVWFTRIGKVSPHFLLLQVIAGIALPRIEYASRIRREAANGQPREESPTDERRDNAATGDDSGFDFSAVSLATE
jgi:hypothetical protein